MTYLLQKFSKKVQNWNGKKKFDFNVNVIASDGQYEIQSVIRTHPSP